MLDQRRRRWANVLCLLGSPEIHLLILADTFAMLYQDSRPELSIILCLHTNLILEELFLTIFHLS